MHPDPYLAADYPTANSPEFVPYTEQELQDLIPDDSLDGYDIIPDLKRNKFQ